MTDPKFIRNFAIVAHIDHGKSTLADRILEITGSIEKRKMMDQILDSNPIERERGITIKLAPVRMKYTFEANEYILNLIDTPGHVDFSYEVSRSLAACEGIILVVDAAAGIQAQTVAHLNVIKQTKLKIIPVLNKIDLETAHPDEVADELVENFGFAKEEILYISAKAGINVERVLEEVVKKIPPPEQTIDGFRALVFSSQYDPHMGVIVFIRVTDGAVSIDEKSDYRDLAFSASKTYFHPLEIGIFNPEKVSSGKLAFGEVGYIATGLKDIRQANVGDTIIRYGEASDPLSGFKKPKPMVFLTFYPTDNDEYMILRESLEKLQLSDSSVTSKPHSSLALGKGFLCGFLGLLHAEIIKERLNREFGLGIVATAPSVEYLISLQNGEIKTVKTPDDYPDPSLIKMIEEPIMYSHIYSPKEYVGQIMQLTQEKRAEYINLNYVGNQAHLEYLIPLSEMIIDFFDRLKSVSHGYASLDYEYYEHRKVDAVKVDILLNRIKADAFSQIVVREKAVTYANKIVEKLKIHIPRHQFQIPIQAAIGGKVIARADISAMRKDVTAKLYGGDRTRKDKLLDTQKKGKKKMRSLGRVEIPQEVFLKVYT
ncbi:MAG: GTP-binding protein LepA, GTP-binding protein LepA [Candidatus Gottesmanbacteria bacterium GW2011_GWA2_43_14]|uniref:Elongation factor 4 n=1 Tax=Candidatus Gottesmanbacteria bacterium GW2011_GWA2_43_14 TaxID=1618443 RepID=A0A0G1DKG7_9BACT|nr:MAG: GTP-binding protein LepA, GTP-binding protein LepA [Candidatus Gottesmanbacteria bacterium GW2011_GWA2_43_14]